VKAIFNRLGRLLHYSLSYHKTNESIVMLCDRKKIKAYRPSRKIFDAHL